MDSILRRIIDIYNRLKNCDELTELLSNYKENLNQADKQSNQNNDFDQVVVAIKKALKTAKNKPENITPEFWKEIIDYHKLGQDDVTRLLFELKNEFTEGSLQTLLVTLIKKDTDINKFFQDMAMFCLTGTHDIEKRLSFTWGPVLTAALKILGPEKIATAISSLITSQNKELNRTAAFFDLDIFRSYPNDDISRKFLELPDFELPVAVILSGLGLQYLFDKTDLTEEMVAHDTSTRSVRGLFKPLIETIKETSFKSPGKLENTLVLQFCMDMIKQARENEDVEWALLKMARFIPVGIFLIIAAILYCLVTHPLPWWKLLFNEIEADDDLKVKRLPPPAKDGPKYIIFSDIHRDARSDQREPLEFGSFDHFSANQELYSELLDYAYENGFTVIEAGDCDELWYYRDFSKRPREKLEEIVDTHKSVYDRLVRLHRDGRYVRLYGNHDACVRKPEIFEVLQKIFDYDRKPEDSVFEIYDFAIIEEVKTMDESILNFGLDSEPYKLKMPMIVAHGHQWDFWNCDHNNIIGKLIVSAIGNPIDFLDDPFKDAGGIAYSGSPVLQFDSILAKAFVLSNFPGTNPARKFAHDIQHLDDFERTTIDDVFFLETLAALSGASIAVRNTADSEETSKMNLICLGHTHHPQSQPYFDLKRLVPLLGDWIMKLESTIIEKTRGIIRPDLSLIKSRYFNSGTVGWMEGVIWAIQIDETGQARQVYWTRDTRPECPQTMDWELPWMDDDLRKKLEVKKGKILNTIEDLSTYIDPLIDSALSSIIRSVAMPFEHLLGLFAKTPAANMYLDSSESLTGPLCHVFLSLLGSDEPKTHTFRISIPDSTYQNILNIKKFLDGFTEINSADRVRLACAWYLFSQSIPFVGTSFKEMKSLTDMLPDLGTFVKSALGLIVQLPGEQHITSPIQTRVTLERDTITIQIITVPLNSKRTRSIGKVAQWIDQDHPLKIRHLWKNMIRLPDSLVYYED